MKKQPKKPEPNTYMSLGLSLGLCFGAALGTIFDDISMYIPIGMCLGLSIGTMIDFSIAKQNKDSVVRHYDLLIEENNDPVHDSVQLSEYMDKWDGPDFISALETSLEKSVLEIGVGTGRLALKVCGSCKHFTGIDISPKSVDRAKENLKTFDNAALICGDYMEYKFTGTFDIVYSSLTFMHISDTQTAIRKASRLLSSGGRFVLSTDKNQNTVIDMNGRILNIYPDTPDEIIKAIKNAKLTLHKQFETEFAHIFVALKEEKQ